MAILQDVEQQSKPEGYERLRHLLLWLLYNRAQISWRSLDPPTVVSISGPSEAQQCHSSSSNRTALDLATHRLVFGLLVPCFASDWLGFNVGLLDKLLSACEHAAQQ